MWLEIRQFHDDIFKFHEFDDEQKVDELFEKIQKFQWRLCNILKNPNDQSMHLSSDIKKFRLNGVIIPINPQMAKEALIMHKTFAMELKECLELVIAADSQKIHFEGMNRGLISVVCYYDAQRLLASALRQILKWDREDLPHKLANYIDDTFINDGLMKYLFGILNTFTVQSEFARLQAPTVNGLGSSKHQKLVRSAVEETRSDTIGCISQMCEYPGNSAVAISNYLFSLVKAVPAERLSVASHTAWVSLVKLTSNDVLTQVQDAPKVLTNMIQHIRKETDWTDQAMCGTMQLACAVSLKSIASSPSDHLGTEGIQVDVERVIDRAIRNMAFQYLRQAIIKSEHFRFAHQFLVVDELLKQLVTNFPAKLMEAERNSSDELQWLDEQHEKNGGGGTAAAARKRPDPKSQTVELSEKHTAQISSTDPSTNYESALSHYENFLRCFVDLYEMQVMDTSYQKRSRTYRERELLEQVEESSMAFSTERSIELCRLLERARLQHHVIHSVAYLELCSAVCKNYLTAALLFDIFSREHGNSEMQGWDSLNGALKAYDRLFKEHKSTTTVATSSGGGGVGGGASTSMRLNQSQSINMSLLHQQHVAQSQQQPSLNLTLRPGDKINIPAHELSGLVAWIRVATKVAAFNERAAQRFSDDPTWTMCSAVTSLATCSVPLSLKAALLGFLSAVARLKSTAPRIWQTIHLHQLCYTADTGKLMGMQQELEERECIEKQYDVSLEFVKLMTTLVMHRQLPEYATPFIQYVTRSILALFAFRSYNSVVQMWELAENALRCTYALLEFGIVEPRAVASDDVHIALLTQCLNDSPMWRSITRVIMEDCQAHNDPYMIQQAPSSDAALIALRIVSRAIVLHPALRSCARLTSADIMVATIPSLVFSQILPSSACTLLDLCLHYLHMCDDYPVHALYAARILRAVTNSRTGAQATMLELLRSRESSASHVRAVRTVLCSDSINYTIDDSLSKEEDTDNPRFARGETARLLLETLSDALDAHVVGNGGAGRLTDCFNICYYLFAFRPNKAASEDLYEDDDALTGLHYVLHIIEQFVGAKKPFDLPFSALLEPAFRLMQRLMSQTCPFATPVLCFMRASSIIEKLATSPFVCSALVPENEQESTYTTGVFSVRRMIVGYILHFTAVEIAAMLTTGHFTKPEVLFRALLESSQLVAEHTMAHMEDDDEDGAAMMDTTTSAGAQSDTPNLLFSLLRRAIVQRRSHLPYPPLVHFDAAKLHEVFDACLSVNIYGVSQYDIFYLNRLLCREIEAVYSECDEVRLVQKEMEGVLEYCAEINAALLSDQASESIVSGCAALLNVFAIHAPVHFFSNQMQLVIFRDACYVLIEMCSSVGGLSLTLACKTLHRLVLTVHKLAIVEYSKLSDQRRFFAPLFKSLVELVIQPAEKCLDAKIHLYKTIRFVLRTLFEKDSIDVVNEAEEWLLDGLIQPSLLPSADDIVNTMDRMADDVARHLEASIADVPKHRKAVVLMVTSDLMHEDLKSNKKMCNHLAKSGVARIVCDELLRLNFDWYVVTEAKKKGDGGVGMPGVSAALQAEHVANHNLFVSILMFFTRFATSESGWNAMSELRIIETLSEMTPFVEPPNELFLKPETVKMKGTTSNAYVNALDLALHLCKQLCTKTKWKKVSLKVLMFVQRLGEVYQQLMRAGIDCECLETAKAIVYEISMNDESIGGFIDGDQVLRQLKQAEESKEVKSNARRAFVNVHSSFAAPRQLFSTLTPF